MCVTNIPALCVTERLAMCVTDNNFLSKCVTESNTEYREGGGE